MSVSWEETEAGLQPDVERTVLSHKCASVAGGFVPNHARMSIIVIIGRVVEVPDVVVDGVGSRYVEEFPEGWGVNR